MFPAPASRISSAAERLFASGSFARWGRLAPGTPTNAGTWSFWLELSDEDPPSAAWCIPKKGEREFIVTVGAPPGTVRSPYLVQVSAEGVGAQTWSIASGTLPLGLALRPTAGVISGTPQITGSFPLTLSATDSRGVTATANLTIVVYPRLALSTLRLSSLRIGHSYRATVRASGGVRPLTFSVRSGRLPIGMRLNAKTGVLDGEPRKPGLYRVAIEARDGLGRTATKLRARCPTESLKMIAVRRAWPTPSALPDPYGLTEVLEARRDLRQIPHEPSHRRGLAS